MSKRSRSRGSEKDRAGSRRCWQVESNSGWVNFDEDVSEKVQAASAAGEATCFFSAYGFDYRVDLKEMQQHNLSTNRFRKIRLQESVPTVPVRRGQCTQCNATSLDGSAPLLGIKQGAGWLCTDCARVYRNGVCGLCGRHDAWQGGFAWNGHAGGQRWVCASCWENHYKKSGWREPDTDKNEVACALCGGACTDGVVFVLESGCPVHVNCVHASLGSRTPKYFKTELDEQLRDSLGQLRRWCSDLASSGHMNFVRDDHVDALEQQALEAISDAWMQFRGVTEIMIQCQRIRELPTQVVQMSSLRSLSITATPLRHLPQGLGALTELQKLWISGTCLSAVPIELAELPKLVNVNLNTNVLTELPCFTSPHIWELNAAGNRLSAAADMTAEGACRDLKALRLNGNRLKELPVIDNCAQLVELDVGGNALSRLEVLEAPPFQDLRWLYIPQNSIRELPEAILQLTALETLVAFSNRLTSLPDGLVHLPVLRTLSLECNPLTLPALMQLLPPRPSMPWTGLDFAQVARWAHAMSGRAVLGDADILGEDHDREEGGHIDSSEPLSVHLRHFHAEQMRKGDAAWPPRTTEAAVKLCCCSGGEAATAAPMAAVGPAPAASGEAAAPPRTRPRVLVVAFSASHASGPEWLGVLSSLSGEGNGDWARWAVVPEVEEYSRADFCELWRYCCRKERMHGEDYAGCDIEEFDVLSTVDARLHWYSDDHAPAFERALARVTRRYERCLFVGSSMGGFGALMHAHLADAVVVFGPQAVMADARLRPGVGGEADLDALTARLCERVDSAQLQGRRAEIQVHCTMDEYFFHALHLPLPPQGVVVHPVSPGRPFSRVLRDTRLLHSIVARAVVDLQSREPRPPPAALESGLDPRRWVRVAVWTMSRLRTRWARVEDIYWLARCRHGGSNVPVCGDWFCAEGHHNSKSEARCYVCFQQGRVPCPWASDERSAVIPGAAGLHANDWGCGRCGMREPALTPWCHRCGEHCSFPGARHLAWPPGPPLQQQQQQQPQREQTQLQDQHERHGGANDGADVRPAMDENIKHT